MDATEGMLVPLGFAVAAFGTLVGAGGGFLLVPVLLILYPNDSPATVTAMSLFVVCANASSGTAAYAWQGRVDYRSGLLFAVGTLPGAIAGSVVVGAISRQVFNVMFAVVLAGLGSWLLFQRTSTEVRPPLRGRGIVQRTLTDRRGNTFQYSFNVWQGIFISSAVGFVSSLLGIGGGVVHVPIMATVLHFPVHVATATSHFVLALMSAEGSAVHLATGDLAPGPPLWRALLLSCGAIPGAQVGARISHHIQGQIIVRVLAVALMAVALRLGLEAGLA